MLTGSCLCGRVTYEVDGKLGVVTYCHCDVCQKAQGGAFVVAAPARRKYFRLVTGADAIADYESSPGKHRHFCRYCGTPLWSRGGERRPRPAPRRSRLGERQGAVVHDHR